MASITKRGPYQYRVLIRIKGQPTISKTFLTREQAKKWAIETENKIRAGVFKWQGEAQNTTLEEALERFKNEYVMVYLKSPEAEIYRINCLKKKKIAKMFLANVKGKDISSLVREMQQEGKKNSTVNRYLAILSRLYEIAKKEWGMEDLTNPVKKIIKPKERNQRDRRLSKEEETRLLQECSPKMKNIILFALETAMRQGEIVNLKWKDVDYKRKIVLVRNAKNGEDRYVPLSPKAIEILLNIKRNNKVIHIDNSVFGTTTRAIKQAFARAKKRARIEDLRFHDLRHEAISRWAERGMDILELAQISGHKDLKMLKRYAHLIPQKIAAKMEKIQN